MKQYGDLKESEKSQIDRILEMEDGYVLDFSNRTIEIYFKDEFEIEVFSDRHGLNGSSKANRIRTILAAQSGVNAAHILRNLWDYRCSLSMYGANRKPDEEARTKANYFEIIAKLEGDSAIVDLQAFAPFDNSNTLHELLQSLERDIRADKPQAAIDRLHLFCIMRFRNLLQARGWQVNREEPLKALQVGWQ
ncbi:MAG: hypothetical protein ABJL72_03550 [Roseobacter sp.]